MKKTILLSALLLSACGSAAYDVPVDVSENFDYVSERFGVAFNYWLFDEDYPIVETENTITNGPGSYRFEVYFKEEGEEIEAAISRMLGEQGYDEDVCEVSEGESGNSYVVDYVGEVEFTEDDLERIEAAELESIKWGGPFDGEFERNLIRTEYGMERCGFVTLHGRRASTFMYDPEFPDRYLFLEGLVDPPFYRDVTLF